MKTAALTLALLLQTTGLWSHLPGSWRADIAERAVGPAAAHTAPLPDSAVTDLARPIRIGTTEPLALSAGSSTLAYDRATAATLFADHATQQRPIASVTKLVTVLVIMSRHQPDELVTVGQLPSYGPDDEIIGLHPGETYRLGDLVRAALVISANDAADALALYDSGTITKFAAQMNLKMAAWDIPGTRFTNPTGLQDTGNYATAAALARIASLVLTNPFLRDTMQQPSATLTSTSGRTLNGPTTNQLLSTGRYYGIKTGYTLAAGQCFVGLTKVQGHEVITVVLGATDRFGQTEQLVNWISHNYQWL